MALLRSVSVNLAELRRAPSEGGYEGENGLVAATVEGEGAKAKQEQGEGGGFGNGHGNNLAGHKTV